MKKSDLSLEALLPRIHALVFVIVFLSVLSLGPRMLNIDGDLPRHLLMGKIVLETRSIPAREIFSYVYEDRAYTPHEWLAGVIYYLIYLALGLNGVVLLAGILIAASFTILYMEAVRQGAGRFVMFLLIVLGALVTSIHWVTRPHLFTMLFLALWLVLADRRAHVRTMNIWLFPIVMLLWANIHAEFIAGFLILLAYLAGCVWQSIFHESQTALRTAVNFLKVTSLAFLASMLNPAGLRVWGVVASYLNNSYLLSRIAETRPPDFTQAEYWPLLALLVIAGLLLGAKRKNYAPAYFFLAAGFGTLSLLSARNAHLAGLVLPFLLWRGSATEGKLPFLEKIDAAVRQMESQAKGSALSMIMTVLVSALILQGPAGRTNRFDPSVFPVEAVHWLEAHPQTGRMFNAFDWGGYILFHLWPAHRVFIESQTDISGEVTREYEVIVSLEEGWQETLQEYEIRWAILPAAWGLTRELSALGWSAVYTDPTAVILVEP